MCVNIYIYIYIRNRTFGCTGSEFQASDLVRQTLQGGGRERSFCYSFYTSPASPHLAEKLHSYSSAKSSWFQPLSFSSSKDSSVEKLRDEDNFRVPTFPQSGRTPNCGDGQKNMDREKLTSPSLKASMKLRGACEKQTKWTNAPDQESRKHLRIETKENPKVSQD
ncbi:hypothetical protein F0562_023399 [Nyssa sinensis]|uniref:Uncharacterized protein n=1 Tax=Nyssa sinensis TaxID=561372 RepID=A0A5J5BH40_9ASTE|nr:hypothetical protein F0562_023399 [Nyssa sinensis]